MAEEQGFHPGHNPWAIALVVTLATFMEVLDTSIANVALQHIAGSLSAGQDESTWVLTSYLVSNAIVLPISGYLATRFGRKRFYMASVGLFTVSSLLCGLAPNLPLLILFRVLQGIGGGGLAPSEQSILADTFPPAKRGMAFAIYGMAVVLAPAMGPTLGGWITDHYSWRWVFFINIPVGVISIVLSHRMIKDPPWLATERKKLGPVDLGGFALVAVGLGALEIVLDKGQREDWFASTYITVFAVLAAVCLVTFVFYELRRKNPIVDVRLVMNRNFGPACLMMLVVGATLFGTTVLLPQFVQTRLGYTATLAGMALSPGGILIMVMMPFIGRLIAKVDGRKMIAFGFLCLAVSLLYTAHHFDMTMSFGVVTKLRMYQAAGLAFLFVPISTVAYVGIPASKYNNASGLINLARNLGGDIGIAVITTMLARRTQIHQTDLSAHTGSASHTLTTRLEGLTGVIMQAGHSHYEAGKRAAAVIARELYAQAETLAYVDVLWLFAVVSGVMVPLAFLMRRQVAGAAPAAH